MKEERKDAARRHARVQALDELADQLRRAWLALDQHRGLESLAEPVEAAVDAVEEALETAGEELEGAEEGRLPETALDGAVEWGGRP